MAASAKRKQEEKHLKMLREMTSLPPNRKCFDCDQRGPTYANMTVGSFVCTSCSGILRGLNPPHRVKSISMTTFTQSEIEFLQKHGNEVCKPIWLGLHDERTSSIPDFREPQKVKDFLQEKYEKKRWWVPPEQAKVVASVHASISGSSNSSTSSTPEVRPLKALLGESAPSLHLNRNTPPNQSPVVSRGQSHPQQFHDKKFDLLSDLGGDIFAGPPNANAGANSSFANFAHFNSHTTFTVLSSSRSMGSTSGGLGNANFANFDNFPKSCSADFGSFSSSSQSNSTGAGTEATQSSGPADRYAALADLDNMFSSGKTEPGGGVPSGTSTNTAAAHVAQISVTGGDRYAALAELNPVFSTSAPSSVYNATSTSHGSMFASESGASSAQQQQTMPTMVPGFGAQSTNPFVAPGIGPSGAPTNPFQSNTQAANVAATAGLMGVLQGQALPPHLASFGTASMSMPSGFGNSAGFNLPTSFSGTFQQQFPGQAPFPQPPAYPQQPNGGYAGFGQAKPVMTPFGQTMAGPMVSSNPFLGAGPSMQYPAGGSSTNPFL
ncbi:arf-GAP domain and FG repeat-containing protein 1a isoform X7 [Eucyclogobius newberryi]|uniref:arf-GAP domain and FG repeat-containing protein 1a isoform X7 n=1 Tax=Eucyclogobius newberryi TaxID=166745 RepID=UPI003B5C6DEA